MSKRYRTPGSNRVTNVTQLLGDRSYYDIETLIKNRLQSAPNFIKRMELEAILEGHNGCVNCLEWNSSGRLLASGSDDCRVILWDPFKHRKVLDFLTPHHGNIFSVKFLPNSGDASIVTGAADGQIFVFDIKQPDVVPIWKCHCHHSRVKRLATAPETPFVFWSVGEDGNVLQFDIREPHNCRAEDKVLLIGLQKHLGPNAEAKCMAINPRRPELLAVGANDVYTRLYDRRMISLEKVNYRLDQVDSTVKPEATVADNIPKDCVTYFCPGHLNKYKDRRSGYSNKAITYLSFSPDGSELLANMGAEQIYLYDIVNGRTPVFLDLPPSSKSTDQNSPSAENTKKKLPEHVESIKKTGNDFLENEKYLQAIYLYSEAINLTPDFPVLYLNRATAFMRRKWYGDIYAGLRDCYVALKLDPSYVKAHFRLARALLELGYVQEANECLEELKMRFPSHATNSGVMMLKKDINSNIENKDDTHSFVDSPVGDVSDNEMHWRSMAIDYKERFVGHCNTTTDIKEANYFGNDGNFVIAGSDDGNFFIWERSSGMITNIYKGDSAIVNCVQPNPYVCMLASSGIDHEVRLWSPQPEENYEPKNKVIYFDNTVAANQNRMQADAFDLSGSGTICRSS